MAMLWPLGMLVLGLSLTVVAENAAEQHQQEELAAFEWQAARMAQVVQERFDHLITGVRSLQGLSNASEEVSAKELESFAQSFDLARDFPGLVGFGLIDLVPRTQAAAWQHARQAQGATLAEPLPTDDAPLLMLVRAEVRADAAAAQFGTTPRNGRVGRDLGAQPLVRAAIARSLASGQPRLAVASSPDASTGPEFLVLQAVAPRKPDGGLSAGHNNAARRLVFAPVSMGALLHDLGATTQRRLELRLMDASAEGNLGTLFETVPQRAASGEQRARPRLQSEQVLQLGGLPLLMLAFSEMQPSVVWGLHTPDRTATAGTLLTLLLAWATGVLALRGARSAARAQALSTEVEMLATVARRTSNSVIVTDPQHRIRWVNEGFERLTGCSAADSLGKSAMIHANADSNPGEMQRLERTLAAGQGFQGELCRRTADGKLRHTAIDIQLLHDAKGRHTGYMALESDITELKAALQRWQARADLSGEWFWQTDDQHRFEVLTERGNMGLSRPEMGQRREEMQQVEPPEGGWQAFHQMLDHHEPFREVRYRVRVGTPEETWVEIEGRPRRDPDGRFIGYEGIGRDVGERLRTLASLRENLALVDAMFEAIPLGVAWKDPQGRYVRVNRAFAEYCKRPVEALVGSTVADISAPQSALLHTEMDQGLMQDGKPRSYETSHLDIDGSRVDVMMCKAPVTTTDGRLTGVVVTVLDISERKATERLMAESKELAEAANRAKSAFLAAMSHEIRTPMNGVVGMAELLTHSPLEEEQLLMVQTMIDSAQSLLRLIDDILDFSKIEAGRLDLDPAPLHLTPLVEGVCTALSPLAGAREVRLSVCMGPELPERVVGDAMRLRQVLNNLIGNAIKFSAGRSGKFGVVTVRVQRDGSQIQFTVSDNGIGIDPRAQERLFQPFTQAEVSTTRRFGGTGLGLAICRRLVDLMGGSIQVRSEPDQGSTFSVSLPLQATADQPVLLQPDLQALACVLVDAEELPVQDMHDWLVHAGAQVRRAPDLRQGWLAATACDALVVLIHDGSAQDLATSEVVPPGLRRLVIGHGRRAAARVVSPTVAELDMVRRLPFLRAVAVAAGRASPEMLSPAGLPALAGERLPAPPLKPARAQGHVVLVAEDDPVNRAVISRQLALLGFAADIANTGTEALRMWRRSRYALLLTDLHMPEMDGYALATKIRQDEAAEGAPRLPILALTANALRGESARAREAGMDEYLTKPVPLKLLQASLMRWLPAMAPPAAPPMPPDVQAVPAGAAPPTAGGWATSAPVLDLAVLHSMVGENRETVREILRDFMASARDQARELRLAFGEADRRHAAAVAHRLKSASRSVGALALGELCAAIERADGSLQQPTQADFQATLAAAMQAIGAHLSEVCA